MSSRAATLLRIQTPQKRRVFFSFHYEHDMWRANQIRNSWRYQKENQREAYGFFDGSIWGNSKVRGDASVKDLIREGLKNTSVTCVLSGPHTYKRRWVRYEIAQSVVQGNGLMTVKIHGLKDSGGRFTYEGQNPLEQMGVYRVGDGRIRLAETDRDGQWIEYRDHTSGVGLPFGWEQPEGKYPIPLSRYGRIYDYVFDNGKQGFGDWVSTAAMEADR